MENKIDCLAWVSSPTLGAGCVALISVYSCEGCKFYKNKAMLDAQVKRIRQRLLDYTPYRGYVPSDVPSGTDEAYFDEF